MRTRQRSYSWYGISKDELRTIFAKLSKLNELERSEVEAVIIATLPSHVAKYVIRSIFDNVGYTYMTRKEGLLALPEDFYGYKRKAVYEAKKWLDRRRG